MENFIVISAEQLRAFGEAIFQSVGMSERHAHETAQILVDAIKGGPVKNALNAPSMSGALLVLCPRHAVVCL